MPLFVITGAPGTGKTTLLNELSQHFTTVAEPARRVIAMHRRSTGEPSLDLRPGLFIDLLTDRSVEDYNSADPNQITFFDRGLPDCVAYATAYGIDATRAREEAGHRRYDEPVFLTPPWSEIYTTDELRKATFSQVEDFHEHVVTAYEDLGYELVELAKTSVSDRISRIVARLDRENLTGPPGQHDT